MYNKFFEEMKSQMKPLMDLAETNKKAMETLAALQSECMKSSVTASVEQVKALSGCKDPKAAVELQIKFYKEMESKLTDTTEKSIAAITEAKEAAVSVMEDMVKSASAQVVKATEAATGKKAA